MARTNAPTEIEQAIAELFRVFRPYRLGDDFSGCDHCVDPRESAHLANTPLDELSASDLRRYAFKALSTWGEVWHFKYFLPRLFQLAAAVPDEFTSLEVLFAKLNHGMWQEWSDVERHAIERYMHAFWAAQIAFEVNGERDDRVDTALCALGRAYDDLSPFLASWIISDSPTACRQLANFFLLNYDQIIGHRGLWNAYWNDRTTQIAQVIDWLRSSAVYEYLYDRQERLGGRFSMVVPLLAEWQSGPAG